MANAAAAGVPVRAADVFGVVIAGVVVLPLGAVVGLLGPCTAGATALPAVPPHGTARASYVAYRVSPQLCRAIEGPSISGAKPLSRLPSLTQLPWSFGGPRSGPQPSV